MMNLKRRVRRSFAGAAALMLVVAVTAPMLVGIEASAEEIPGVDADMYLLINADTGEVLADSNADQTFYGGNYAVLANVMTALELQVNPDAPIGFTAEAIAQADALGTYVKMDPAETAGEIMSVREMMYCITMGQSPVAAYQLSTTISNGDENAYLTRMNDLVAGAGADKTGYSDVAGMNGTDLTTVEDCADIFLAALDYPELVGMLQYGDCTLGANNMNISRYLLNSNDFINEEQTLDGALYGYRGTDGAGATTVMATLVQRENVKLLCVVAGDTCYEDTAYLIEYGFDPSTVETEEAVTEEETTAETEAETEPTSAVEEETEVDQSQEAADESLEWIDETTDTTDYGLDEAAHSRVLSAQIKEAREKRTWTYIALGAAAFSIIGLVVLNRKP